MKKLAYSLILCLCLFAWQPKATYAQIPASQSKETAEMVRELQLLVEKGHPNDYYHWNQKQAQWLSERIINESNQIRMDTWFAYCQQALLAGETQACINELSTYLAQDGRTYQEILSEQNQVLFELLALAYLRLGEQQNCQHKHTAASCILPLQQAGWHTLKNGSQQAIKIYSLLHDTFPKPTYKWLINLAYMTLGEYPQNVPEPYRIPFPHPDEQPSFPKFEEIAMSAGLAQDGLSGGVCIEDFNQDGFLDLFMTSYGMEDNVQFLVNDREGGFVNTSLDAGLKGIVSGLNCLHADYDNDGYQDILVLRGGWLKQAGKHPNSLLKNMGDGSFQDVTRSSGILSYHPTQTACWGDFNNDGYLDLFIGNESYEGDLHPCELFRNNGDGTFTEAAKEFGLDHIYGYVKGVSCGDFNNDGWLDIYVSVLGGNNLLFKNEDGKFADISQQAGVSAPFFSFPCWFWDVNNDGFDDIFVSGYDMRFMNDVAGEYAKELQGKPIDSEKPRLYLNNGDESFRESSEQFGIDKTMFAMGSNFGDLDNDGYLDFYVGTGAPDFSTVVPNRMFRNVEGSRFEEVTSAGNFGHIQKGHGIAFADLDRDGDQDIYAVMGGAYEGDNFTNILYKNPISQNNWIIIQLEGTKSNRSAIGTKIELELENGRKIYRSVSTGGSFGASPLQQEIGLGQADRIKTLTIHWTNQAKQSFEKLAVNRKILIKEGAKKVKTLSYESSPFRLHGNHHGHK